MSKLRWGVLGCSGFARSVAVPALKEASSAEVVAVASREAERARAFAAELSIPRWFGSYEEMLEDEGVDAVYNPLPNALHAAWTIRAVAAGKHVLVEKPFATSATEAIAVASAARQAGRHVMEGFMWRFHPQHEEALRRVRDGEIGPVRLVRASFTFSMPRRPDIRWDPALGGGATLDVGCYTVSAARAYFGAEPTSVMVRRTRDEASGVDMSMAAILEFAEGRAIAECGFHVPFRSCVEVVGEKGVLVVEAPWVPSDAARLVVNGEVIQAEPANQYTRQFEHFSRAILDGVRPRYDAEDAVLQMRVLDAIIRSARSGRQESV